MLIGLSDFLKSFKERKGAYIFFSTILSKAFSLLLSIFIVQLLPKTEYGSLMYAYTIISFVMPFMGFGIYQSYLKYAPLEMSFTARQNVFLRTLFGGVFASVILMILVWIATPLATINQPNSFWFLVGFSVLLVSSFIFESFKNLFRVIDRNKTYAVLEIMHAVLLLVLGVVLSFFIGGLGFVIAIVIAPLVISFYLLISHFRLLLGINLKMFWPSKQWWYFGIYTSFGGVVSQLIFSVDMMSIGNLMSNPEWLAQYKAMSLLPFSLFLIPNIFIKTDFVTLVKEARNRSFLIHYYRNFLVLMALITIPIVIALVFFNDTIVHLLFGPSYLSQVSLLSFFSLGVVAVFVLRVPLGNILIAIGWTKISTLISLITLIADVILNYYWIPIWGIWGAAYATVFLLWLSGITVFITFLVYLKRLKRAEI